MSCFTVPDIFASVSICQIRQTFRQETFRPCQGGINRTRTFQRNVEHFAIDDHSGRDVACITLIEDGQWVLSSFVVFIPSGRIETKGCRNCNAFFKSKADHLRRQSN